MVDKIATTGVIHLGISDHSLIYAVRKFAVPKTRPTIKEVRNFKHFVEVDFINDLKRVSWQNVECFDDPNLAWQAWKSDFNAILDHHAPIRHMRVRQSSVPWLTFDIKRVMKERDYHKKHAVKYGSHNHWVLYQSARNKVNSMMRTAKSDYFRRKIDASINQQEELETTSDMVTSQCRKLTNWKARGRDGVQGFWFKKLRGLHERIAEQLTLDEQMD